MKRSWLIWLALLLFVVGGTSWAVCPEDPNDLGKCDTMYIEPWPADVFLNYGSTPYLARVSVYATSDVAVASYDSIIGFVFPLCYTHTNPSKYCSLTFARNTCHLSPSPADSIKRSIFRHLERSPGDTLFNRMMRLSQTNPGLEWDNIILNLDGTSHFWLAMIPGPEDKAWWEGSKVLVATMTFRLEDTMQICIDTCFWPPATSLSWVRGDAIIKVPRMGSPHDPDSYKTCFSFRFGYEVKITDITDVGNDQGKQVRIDWKSFPHGLPLVNHFTIFRRIDPLLSGWFDVPSKVFSSKDYPPGSWEMVGTYPAYDETVYSATSPTLKDSTAADGMHWSVFFVRAGTDDPSVYYDSPIDSGYSLDNLSPYAPTGLFASHEKAGTRLRWQAVPDEDFDYYTLYRDTVSDFMPEIEKRLGFTIDTSFVDSTADLGEAYFYLASATDFSGNESNPSNEAMGVNYITGDVNADSVTNLGDVVYLITYLYKSGPAPVPLLSGDANCSGEVELGDVVYLISYLYKGGPAPSCK